MRPLVKRHKDEGESTQGLSREHTVLVSRSGLVTVTGGKWTTYRAMAEDVLEHCFNANLLPRSASGATADMTLLGGDTTTQPPRLISAAPALHLYGDEASMVLSWPGADQVLCAGLGEAMVRFTARPD